MDIYRVALFGHRDFCATQEIEDKLYDILHDLMQTRPCVEIYMGRNGEFDLFAASVVKRIKKSLTKGGSHKDVAILLVGTGVLDGPKRHNCSAENK